MCHYERKAYWMSAKLIERPRLRGPFVNELAQRQQRPEQSNWNARRHRHADRAYRSTADCAISEKLI